MKRFEFVFEAHNFFEPHEFYKEFKKLQGQGNFKGIKVVLGYNKLESENKESQVSSRDVDFIFGAK